MSTKFQPAPGDNQLRRPEQSLTSPGSTDFVAWRSKTFWQPAPSTLRCMTAAVPQGRTSQKARAAMFWEYACPLRTGPDPNTVVLTTDRLLNTMGSAYGPTPTTSHNVVPMV